MLLSALPFLNFVTEKYNVNLTNYLHRAEHVLKS